jgi:hypothetical protein
MTLISQHDVEICRQARKSLALRVTPDGLVALIPNTLDPAGDAVRDFIRRAIARLPDPETLPADPITPDQLHARIDRWAARLDVTVGRIQIRAMRTKWASCSTQGTLTLNTDILRLPADLIDYILVHELLHLRIPDHNKGWQAMMSAYLPDWRRRQRRLMVL